MSLTARSARQAAGALVLAAAGAQPALAAWFTDVTSEAGLDGRIGYRLSIADLNGDGYPDIVAHRRSDWATGDVLDNQFVYLNVPDPSDPSVRRYEDFTAESNIRANRAGTADGRHSDAVVFADVDNDGDLDAFTTVYLHDNDTLATNTNDLLLNDGTGRFTLAPASPFHSEPIINTAAAVFMDLDRDSSVDLFVGQWYRFGSLSQDALYQGHGDGTFTNVTASSGIGGATTAVYGISAFDADGDGYTDLFAPSYSHTRAGATSIHWHNNRDGTFTRVEASSGFDDYTGFGSGRASFGALPGDFDGDAQVDFLSILTHGNGDGASGVHSTTVRNAGGTFSWDFYRVAGRGAEDPDTSHHGDHYAAWLDFDNDGYLDFALTESGYSNNRIYVFRNDSDGTFYPVTPDTGLDAINDADLPPHNVLALDYDRDGDLDLLVGFTNNSEPPQLWRNDVGSFANWIALELEGGGAPGLANRSAIDARVTLEAGGVSQSRSVYAGPGHQGPQMPLALHFGLRGWPVVDTLTVRWPNSALSESTFTDVCINRYLTIREVCAAAAEPGPILLTKSGRDARIHWPEPTDPAEVVWWWQLYREETPDPAGWIAPHASCLADEDPAVEGVQHDDPGALRAGTLQFYRLTALNDCGETTL